MPIRLGWMSLHGKYGDEGHQFWGYRLRKGRIVIREISPFSYTEIPPFSPDPERFRGGTI